MPSSLYDITDYKAYIRSWVESQPGGGRGAYRRMAQALGISSTLVSQVVNGPRHFSLENASDLADFLSLGDKESEYLLLLVEFARAGTHRYSERLNKKIERAQRAAQSLVNRLERDRELTEAESATYYSSWAYTAVTHLIACDPSLSVDALSLRLHLPRNSTAKILGFLMDTGILIKREGGGMEVGPKLTHIGADSPLVTKHHQNWRLRGFNQMIFASPNDLFYTAPMSLSHETAKTIRQELPSFIEKIVKWVGPSPSETVRCLNIDWFEY